MQTTFQIQIDHLPNQVPQMDKLLDAILDHGVEDKNETQVQIKQMSPSDPN